MYQTLSSSFVCQDKYYGQKLNVSGFHDGLTQFLSNGHRLRVDALNTLLGKLRELRQVLLTLDTFRFYTSSLLLAYEGRDDDVDDGVNNSSGMIVDVEVAMIDFAHSTYSELDKKKHEGPDAGYIFGLNNLISTLEQISDENINSK